MPLRGADEYINHTMGYRVVNIWGRYGSGKTLLAVATAFELWKRGHVDYIHANHPMSGRSEGMESSDFVMILDEAHKVLDARKFSSNASQTWLDSLRKRNAVLILPAVISVDVRFRVFLVQRLLKVGDIVWFYRWQIDDGVGVNSGIFRLVNPKWYYGSYPTLYEPFLEDYERLKNIMERTDEKTKRYIDNSIFYPVQEVSYPVEEPSFKRKISDVRWPWQDQD